MQLADMINWGWISMDGSSPTKDIVAYGFLTIDHGELVFMECGSTDKIKAANGNKMDRLWERCSIKYRYFVFLFVTHSL